VVPVRFPTIQRKQRLIHLTGKKSALKRVPNVRRRATIGSAKADGGRELATKMIRRIPPTAHSRIARDGARRNVSGSTQIPRSLAARASYACKCA